MNLSRVLRNLKSPKLELAVTGGTNLGSGQFQIRAVCSNASLDAGFFAREVGVYAKVGATGVEKLIAYTTGEILLIIFPIKACRSTPKYSRSILLSVTRKT